MREILDKISRIFFKKSNRSSKSIPYYAAAYTEPIHIAGIP